jgi:hypothetical protein
MMEGMSVAFERTCTYDSKYENAKMINWPDILEVDGNMSLKHVDV